MIEFIEGEPCCRWNGILMTEEKYEELFGIEEEDEPIIEDDIILVGDVIYTNLCFGDLFKWILETEAEHRDKEPEYDIILSKGCGFDSHSERKRVECSYIIKEDVAESYFNSQVLPYESFEKDFPNFNKKEFLKFQDELDDYFNNFNNNPKA